VIRTTRAAGVSGGGRPRPSCRRRRHSARREPPQRSAAIARISGARASLAGGGDHPPREVSTRRGRPSTTRGVGASRAAPGAC
jgi:hypothetical protein